MGLLVNKETRDALLSAIRPKYKIASGAAKARLLDNFIGSTGYNRKHAITLLNATETKARTPRPPKSRALGEEALGALVLVWNVADQVCAKRLVPFLPDLLRNLESFGRLSISEEARQHLLHVSAATVDRVLKTERQKHGRSRSLTKNPNLIKNRVPIRTFTEWTDVRPGFFEIDTVSHCSRDVSGAFLSTLNMTCIATCWTVPVGIYRKGALDVICALDEIALKLPFPILGLDFDNGSEFLNYELLDWCEERNISYSRSREYKKNDQAWIEEKNGSVVRRAVGRERFEGTAALNKLNELYRTLYLYYNFFQPCQKLLLKTRVGSKSYRKHDVSKTPCQRVLESPYVSEESKRQLILTRDSIDVFRLFTDLKRLQQELKEFAIDVPGPVAAALIAQRNAAFKFCSSMNSSDLVKAVEKDAAYKHAKGTTQALRAFVSELPIGTILASKDFKHLGNVSRKLPQLVKESRLKKLGRSLFEVTEPPAPESGTRRLRFEIQKLAPGTQVRSPDYKHLFKDWRYVRLRFNDMVKQGYLLKIGRNTYEKIESGRLENK